MHDSKTSPGCPGLSHWEYILQAYIWQCQLFFFSILIALKADNLILPVEDDSMFEDFKNVELESPTPRKILSPPLLFSWLMLKCVLSALSLIMPYRTLKRFGEEMLKWLHYSRVPGMVQSFLFMLLILYVFTLEPFPFPFFSFSIRYSVWIVSFIRAV